MTVYDIRPNTPYERDLTCTRCGMRITVCGAVSDLDPDTYVGVACGCRLTPRTDLAAVIDRAQQAQKGAVA